MQIKTRLYVKVLFINTFPNTGFLIEPFYYPTGVSNSYGKGWDAFGNHASGTNLRTLSNCNASRNH